MLHYYELRQLTRQHQLQRESEAAGQRLALQVRGRRERRARRRLLATGLKRLSPRSAMS
jgi:hypothetical protein